MARAPLWWPLRSACVPPLSPDDFLRHEVWRQALTVAHRGHADGGEATAPHAEWIGAARRGAAGRAHQDADDGPRAWGPAWRPCLGVSGRRIRLASRSGATGPCLDVPRPTERHWSMNSMSDGYSWRMNACGAMEGARKTANPLVTAAGRREESGDHRAAWPYPRVRLGRAPERRRISTGRTGE